MSIAYGAIYTPNLVAIPLCIMLASSLWAEDMESFTGEPLEVHLIISVQILFFVFFIEWNDAS